MPCLDCFETAKADLFEYWSSIRLFSYSGFLDYYGLIFSLIVKDSNFGYFFMSLGNLNRGDYCATGITGFLFYCKKNGTKSIFYFLLCLFSPNIFIYYAIFIFSGFSSFSSEFYL